MDPKSDFSLRYLPRKIKVAHSTEVQDENYAISPSTPLLSTSLEENGWVCGQIASEQVAAGGTPFVKIPRPLQVVKRWATLSISSGHSAGVCGEGKVYTWGRNDYGQLGEAPSSAREHPSCMESMDVHQVRALACGAEHTVAVTPNSVISWGGNAEGQCGHGENAERIWTPPRMIKSLTGTHVVQVVCGQSHTLCVTAISQVYAWGCNWDGQLGLADRQNRLLPAHVSSLWAMPVAQLAAGDAHSAALTTNGFLFTWGCNAKGQLGLPAKAEAAAQARMAQRTASEKRRLKRKVNQRFLTAMVEMGFPSERAELALSETGNVGIEVATEWLFSVSEEVLEKHLESDPNTPTSDTANTDDFRVLVPRRVPLKGVRSVAAGGSHTVAVTDGGVYAWGSNSCGQLGVARGLSGPAFQDQMEPQLVEELRGKAVLHVACGSDHTLFLCRDGSLYGCGSNSYGQLPLEDRSTLCLTTPDDMDTFFPMPSPSTSPSTSYNDDEDRQLKMLSGTSESTADDEPSVSSRLGDVPFPVDLHLPLLQRKSGGRQPLVSMVVAGGNSSGFLTRARDELPDAPTPQLLERLQSAIASCKQNAANNSKPAGLPQPLTSPSVQTLQTAIRMVFGSAAAISATFGFKDRVGIDVELLESIQVELAGLCAPWASTPAVYMHPGKLFLQAYISATQELLMDLDKHVKQLGSPERAQVLLVALHSHILAEQSVAGKLIPNICEIILNAPSSCRHLLVKWWADYKAVLLRTRVVEPLQQFLTSELSQTKKLTKEVMNTIKVLAKVEEANQLGRQLPPEAFYNDLISEKLDVEDHYVAWRQSHDLAPPTDGAEGPFSFCSFPFLLSPRAKSKLLYAEARIKMTQTVNQARAEERTKLPDRLGRSTADQTVLPVKRANKAAPSEAPRRQLSETEALQRARLLRQDSARRDQQGLRGLWHTMWRTSDGAPSQSISSTSVQVDERHMAARELTGAHARAMRSGTNSPTASSSQAQKDMAIARHGSMNLPKPEDSGVAATHPEMCIIRVRRCHLLEDAMSEIARQRHRDLLKPIRIHFIGEEGVDAGGIKKEFFQLLVTEMLSPDYGMLIFLPESRTYWFHASSLEDDEEFLLMGLVLGLAVYNSVLLDFPLPLALYRKLLGQSCSLRDLQDMEPLLGKSLNMLLEFDGPGSVEDVFCQNFTVGLPGIGQVLTVPLIEGGDNLMVTEENRREYVDMYVEHYLNVSVHRQFEAFTRGFMMVVGGPAIALFSATELERLVCGNPILDFSALEQNARYDGGYTPESQPVMWLWSIVNELTGEEQRRFLKFFTGSDRAPIGGLANLRCIIQRAGPDTDKLPTSHTCFNTLLLPSYCSKDKMATRLRLAIMNSEGFGME
eukprot:jgi/Botrbrau1/9696/Bobra.0201s0026.1